MVNWSRRQSHNADNRLPHLLTTLVSISLLGNDACALPQYQTAGITFAPQQMGLPPPASQGMPRPAAAKTMVLKADDQGHFRGTALINNVPMPFMIDTGATMTAIPANWAEAAGLPAGQAIQTHTAGGQVVDQLTTISRFQMGTIQFRNLNAQINVHVREVLIGMNTLKYFHITQRGDALMLVLDEAFMAPRPNTDHFLQPAVSEILETEQPVRKPASIKKTVVCNERHLCRTIYSDRKIQPGN